LFIPGKWEGYILRVPAIAYDPDFSETIADIEKAIGSEEKYRNFAYTMSHSIISYLRKSISLNYLTSSGCFGAIPERLPDNSLNITGRVVGAITELKI